MVLTGFIHYKKIPGYKSEAEVTVESNPYVYKLPPGHALHVYYPFLLLATKILVKIADNEKLDKDDIKEVKEIQKKIDVLLKGGYVGTKGRGLSFGQEKVE